jgi:hypothetical protein
VALVLASIAIRSPQQAAVSTAEEEAEEMLPLVMVE